MRKRLLTKHPIFDHQTVPYPSFIQITMNKVREKNIYEFNQVGTIKIPMVFLASQAGLNLNVKLHRISLYFKGYSEPCQ